MSGRISVATRLRSAARDSQQFFASAIQRVAGSIPATRAGATTVTASAGATTRALQTLPDSTLRWLTAGSVGLGVGLYLAGAPRLATAAGVTPALVMGAAMVARPTVPDVTDERGAS
jgi:hypothetical protein